MMEKELNNNQNRKLTIFACILSVVSIGLLVFGFLAVSSSKVILLQSVSNLFNKLDYVDKSSKKLTDKIISSSDVGVRSNVKVSSDFLNGSIAIDYLENKKDKKSELDLDFNINEQKLIGANFNFSDDKLHMFVDDITPNYYYVAQEFVSLTSGLNSSDSDKIVALLKESVTDYIDNDDIAKKKETVTYNGKDKKVNKLTYKVTNKVIKDIVSNFIASIKKDKELFNKIAKVSNITKDELNTLFDEFLESLNYETEVSLFNYNIYYYGFNKIIRYETVDLDNNMTLQYKVEEKESISLLENSEAILYLEIVKAKKGHTYNGYVADSGIKNNFSGSVTDNTLTLIMDSDGSKVKVVIDSIDNQKENSYKFDIKLFNVINNQEEKLIEISVDLEYYFGEKIKTNLGNSVDINNISEEDMMTIYTNLSNHPLYQLIAGLTGSMELSL